MKVIEKYVLNAENKYVPKYENAGFLLWLKRQFHNPFDGFEKLFVK